MVIWSLKALWQTGTKDKHKQRCFVMTIETITRGFTWSLEKYWDNFSSDADLPRMPAEGVGVPGFWRAWEIWPMLDPSKPKCFHCQTLLKAWCWEQRSMPLRTSLQLCCIFEAVDELLIVDSSEVSEGNCSKIVVRWGAKGEILELLKAQSFLGEASPMWTCFFVKREDGLYLVNFPETVPLVSPHLAAAWYAQTLEKVSKSSSSMSGAMNLLRSLRRNSLYSPRSFGKVNGCNLLERSSSGGEIRNVQRCNSLWFEPLKLPRKFSENETSNVCFSPQLVSRSKRVMRAGQPGVVRDLRADMDSVVLRLAPVGAVDCFDLSVSWLTKTDNGPI